jgi:hypothetical protein
MPLTKLHTLAHARSGDKGSAANVGVIARTPAAYHLVQQHLTAEKVQSFFADQGVGQVTRFDLPNLHALNFLLPDILNPLKPVAQGKTLGQQLLELELEIDTQSPL